MQMNFAIATAERKGCDDGERAVWRAEWGEERNVAGQLTYDFIF